MIELIANYIKKATGEEAKVTIPENSELGEYTTNLAFILAKKEGVAPVFKAEEIKEKILKTAPSEFFEAIDVLAPGFLNFKLSEKTLIKEAGWILKEDKKYGSSKSGKGKTAIVDYSAPNIAKPMSVGHLRSTVIGAAIVNLLRAEGYKVIGDNHLGDWGTQFGKLIYSFNHWADKEEFKKNPVGHLVSLYVRFHKEAEGNEEMENAAREETAKLQRGDKKNLALWKKFVAVSLKEFNKTYKRLGVKFEKTLGESFYQSMLSGVVKDVLNKGIAKKDEGAIKVFFDNEKWEPEVIEKTDGSHLYFTTDLAAIKYRAKKFKPDKILYVVGNEQSLHLEKTFNTARKLGYVSDKVELEHIKFGMLLGESGKKFSTRRGEFITLDSLFDRAVSEAALINEDSAEKVGVGAMKYYDLSHYRLSDIVFDWDRVLDLKGDSSPYLQYTYARLKKIMRKARNVRPKLTGKISGEYEKKVVRSLIHFGDAIAYAALKYEPNHLAEYLFKLANELNAFYENCPIASEENKKLAAERMAIAKAGAIVMRNGLKILGIEVMEEM